MAIIRCPECNNTVSDQAGTCPHCGYPLKKQGSTHVLTITFYALAPKQYGLSSFVSQFMSGFIKGQIENDNGTVIDIRYGGIAEEMLWSSQTVTVTYQAPWSFKKSNLKVTFKTKGFSGTMEAEQQWF